jgi:cardiolipin synthase
MHPVVELLLTLFYFYVIISIILVILLENRYPTKSLAWIIVLLFVPVVGLIFYLFLGQNFRKEKIISKKSIRRVTDRPVASFDISKLNTSHMDNNQLNIIKLLYNNSESAGYAYNKIDIYADGESTYEALFEAIRSAKDHIHIEFFIVNDDRISNQLRELLIEKAKEGVRVRMIYDFWGSFNLSKKYINSLKEAGVYLNAFLPMRLRLSRSKVNYRNHRKIVVVDGTIGFTGGLNIADRYRYGNKLGKWRDTFVKIEGSAVHGLQMLFLIDWYFVERKLITDEKYYPVPKIFTENLVQIVPSGPDTDHPSVMQGIVSAIMSATQYVYIHTPYYVPSEILDECIKMSALSNVDVRLMIPQKSDSRMTDACTHSYLKSIMESGVRIFQYKGGFLHSKAIVIDDFISIIGSTNLDERSFKQNFEVNAFIYEKTSALHLKELFLQDLEVCEEISLTEWNQRSKWQKLKESLARLLSPLM